MEFNVEHQLKVEAKEKKEEDSNALEEIGKYRAQAQQNSIDAIRAAEERHAKAKDSSSGGGGGGTKETVKQGLGVTKDKLVGAKDAIVGVGEDIADYMKTVKDVVVGSGEGIVGLEDRAQIRAMEADSKEPLKSTISEEPPIDKVMV